MDSLSHGILSSTLTRSQQTQRSRPEGKSCKVAPWWSYGHPLNETGFDLRRAHEELRWLLRSYAPYVGKNSSSLANSGTDRTAEGSTIRPWIRKIFVIHSDLYPPPSYLRESESLRFVRHSEFIPGHALPTFLRGVIMSHVINIPDLQE